MASSYTLVSYLHFRALVFIHSDRKPNLLYLIKQVISSKQLILSKIRLTWHWENHQVCILLFMSKFLYHGEWWNLPVACHSPNADGPGSTRTVLTMVLLCRLFWKEASGRSTEGRLRTGSGFGWEIHKGVQQSPEALRGGDVQHLEAAGYTEEAVQLGVLARQPHNQWRRHL